MPEFDSKDEIEGTTVDNVLIIWVEVVDGLLEKVVNVPVDGCDDDGSSAAIVGDVILVSICIEQDSHGTVTV